MGDFSCYITIQNNSAHVLSIMAPPPEDGSWQNVPATVPAHQQASFALKDPPGPTGSEGGFVAAVVGTEAMLQANFQDGYVQSNYCNASMQGGAATMAWTFEGGSGDQPVGNWEQGNVPGGGHPVWLSFTFSDTAPGPAPPA